MRRLLALLFVLAASQVCVACNKEKNADCTSLVQAVGPQHQAIKESFGRSDMAPADLETQAAAFEKASGEIAALPLKDASIKALATEYAGVLGQAAKVRREMAAAASALDPTAAAKTQASATSLVTAEMQAMAKIDTTCR